MATQVKPNRFLVDEHGKPQAVVLSLVSYRKLIRLIDDQEDAKILKRAIRTSRGTISHTELLGRLKRKHLL